MNGRNGSEPVESNCFARTKPARWSWSSLSASGRRELISPAKLFATPIDKLLYLGLNDCHLSERFVRPGSSRLEIFDTDFHFYRSRSNIIIRCNTKNVLSFLSTQTAAFERATLMAIVCKLKATTLLDEGFAKIKNLV